MDVQEVVTIGLIIMAVGIPAGIVLVRLFRN